MVKIKENDYYEKISNWSFDEFQIKTENYTNWDLYEILKKITNEESRILDLGTGGGEKLLKYFPQNVKEILGTDLSKSMIETANKNLKESKRKNVIFRIMDNLKMDIPEESFDVIVARNTVTDSRQIYKALKPGGYLLIRGVDKFDCHMLKRIFGQGQSFDSSLPISILDYEAVLDAGFKEVELVPIYEKEYFKSKELLYKFLLKVPILDEFSKDGEDFFLKELDKKKLDEYIAQNTYDKGILLQRRYYGIIAKK